MAKAWSGAELTACRLPGCLCPCPCAVPGGKALLALGSQPTDGPYRSKPDSLQVHARTYCRLPAMTAAVPFDFISVFIWVY